MTFDGEGNVIGRDFIDKDFIGLNYATRILEEKSENGRV